MFHINHSGFILIEALIAWAIATLVLFSLIQYQTESIHRVRHAYFVSVAITQLNNLLDRLRANQTVSGRQRELKVWNGINKQLLPQGKGNYHCHQHICVVQVKWQERTEKRERMVVTL